MTTMYQNKLFILMYCIPMITTGCCFQIFIFYDSHRTRRNFCEKFIFHVELQREILKKCSATLVVPLSAIRHEAATNWYWCQSKIQQKECLCSQISRESKVRSREHGPLEDVNPTYYSSSHTLKMIVRYEISDQEIYTASRIGFIIVS